MGWFVWITIMLNDSLCRGRKNQPKRNNWADNKISLQTYILGNYK